MQVQMNKPILKKHSPMSDEEIEENSFTDINTAIPCITDNRFGLHSPDNTVYGDFSMNSFLIVDTPEKDENDQQIDACISEHAIFIHEKEARNHETSYVYMESIIDLMKGLNTKIDTLQNERSEERLVLERAMSFFTIGDSRSAEEAIQCYSNIGNPVFSEIFMNLIRKTLPQFFINLKEELLNTKEIAITLKNIYTETDTKLFKKLEENERLKNIINQQSKDHKLQIEDLSKENNYLKDQILKITTEYGNDTDVESLLEDDILHNLKRIIQGKCKEIEALKDSLIKKDQALTDFYSKESSFDISHLNIQIEGYRKTQTKIQAENLNLTQIVNKLSEKNTKLKQELLFFNSELKKTMDMLGKKNDTISRQKSLIELFQEKLSGSSFPIEELRKKKIEVEKKLISETDYFVKQDLKKKSEDCDKRLSDFLSLNRRL